MIRKAFDLIDRFAPSPEDYAVVMSNLMSSHPQFFDEECLRSLINVVADGPTDEEEPDRQFRNSCLKHMVKVLEQMRDSPSSASVVAGCVWVIGACLHTASSKDSHGYLRRVLEKLREVGGS